MTEPSLNMASKQTPSKNCSPLN